MSIFFIIRHADSEAEKFIPGRMRDVHLSEKGISQALKLAQSLSKTKIDKIISSPLERVLETAWYLADRLGTGIEVNHNLIEIDFGSWTGKLFDDMDKLNNWKLFHELPIISHIPGGELFIEAQNRIVNEFEILKKTNKDKNICIFSHNDPIRLLTAYYMGIPLAYIHRFKIGTASLTALEIKDNIIVKCLNVKELNDYL